MNEPVWIDERDAFKAKVRKVATAPKTLKANKPA
jgi:hypothetical protein